MKRRLGPSDRLYPMPVPLVCGGTMEHADACAVAWIGICATDPPRIALALRESRYTLELIRASGTLTVNTPRAADAAVVDYFGITSGRATDKFAGSGWTLELSVAVEAPRIAECPYQMECRVTHEIPLGSHVLVVAEVVESHAEDSILDASGSKVDVGLLDPLVYIAGSREYRRLGEKVADAYTIGKGVGQER
ncbi:MAG: flavin reductase family protein [Coriobacteriia bacterium]|nr:flavin reductase family protein [Coriobacteriia bacterium]MBN2839372.1 flavin reductase family protein [Coriobacteriia bacterium]